MAFFWGPDFILAKCAFFASSGTIKPTGDKNRKNDLFYGPGPEEIGLPILQPLAQRLTFLHVWTPTSGKSKSELPFFLGYAPSSPKGAGIYRQ